MWAPLRLRHDAPPGIAQWRCHLLGNGGATLGLQADTRSAGVVQEPVEGGNDVQSLSRSVRPVRRPEHGTAPRRIPTLIAVAVVADDDRLTARVDSALRREGVAGHVEHAGPARLREDGVQRRPDVVLVAGTDTETSVAEASRVRRWLPGAHVVMVLDGSTACNVRRLLEAGVDGVVLEPDLEETLGLVVRAVCGGHLSLPRSMRHAVEPPALSELDREILAFVVAGLSNAEIAARLFLARSTVAGRLTSVFRRLGVQSRTEAVSLVLAGDESLRESVAPASLHDTGPAREAIGR
jgi:DNA-binding NarL/FixJ family response regulator